MKRPRKSTGSFLAAIEHVGHALVRGVAAGEELAVEQQHFAWFPGSNFGARDGVEIHAARSTHVVGELGPVFERGRIEKHRPRAIEHDVRVARGGAVGNHGHGQVGGVARRVQHLHVEHGGQAAQSLRADAQPVHFVIELDAELFRRGLGAARDEFLNVDGVHQRLFGQAAWPFPPCRRCRCRAFPAGTSRRPWWAPS